MSPEFSSALAVFGTASDVGKSLMTAAFCRLLRDDGYSVAPFKAQNMSNNSYVALDGGEIGRAQYVQAIAARTEPSVHHNPVLLKPSADDFSQLIVHGQAVGRVQARAYFEDTEPLRRLAFQSLARLQQQHDVVVLEGAGSCAEVNLRAREFVNFPAAHQAHARVVLVADIDRGGVFAQIVGSLAVMPDEDRARVSGIIVNKFRGDRSLFDDGVAYLERHTGLPILGVVPYEYGLDLDSEDAVPLTVALDPPVGADADKLKIAVLRLPHISNFTDFDALARVPSVAVHYIYRARPLGDYAAVVLPGSKNVAADLGWLRQSGLFESVLQYHRAGGKLVGICGGLQMLGTRIVDAEGIESNEREVAGFGLIDAVTELRQPKLVRRVQGAFLASGIAVTGYEIHLGRTSYAQPSPLLVLDVDGEAVVDGVLDVSRRTWATYLHGVFDEAPARQAFLRWVDPSSTQREVGPDRIEWVDEQLDAFAAHIRKHVDWGLVRSWLTDAVASRREPRG
ncbi:MAG TPA: cobyric acid synthase [Polyangiaceae bacterium]